MNTKILLRQYDSESPQCFFSLKITFNKIEIRLQVQAFKVLALTFMKNGYFDLFAFPYLQLLIFPFLFGVKYVPNAGEQSFSQFFFLCFFLYTGRNV